MATPEQSHELSDQYLVSGFPSKYRDALVNDARSAEEFVLRSIHELFQSGEYKGETAVEVGCGPTIHRLATLCKYYDEVITSDYAPENKDSVKKWLAGGPQALDWTPFLEVIAECEGYSEIPSGVKDIEARIRGKVKSVIHCDVLKSPVFQPDIEEVDLLTTSGCIEGACPNQESFTSAVKRLGQYVKRDGYIMMYSVLGMSSVGFGDKEIKVLSIDEDLVHRSLKEAGFSTLQKIYKKNDYSVEKFDGSLLVIARKV